MSFLDGENLSRATSKDLEDIVSRVTSTFLSDVNSIGYYRPRMFIFDNDTYEILVEAAIRKAEGDKDKNLALTEAMSLLRLCGSTKGVFAYDEIIVDEITDEQNETIVVLVFNESGLLITSIPYDIVDGSVVFSDISSNKLNVNDIKPDMITNIAFSFGSERQNMYNADYIDLLKKRGHEIIVHNEEDIYKAYPI